MSVDKLPKLTDEQKWPYVVALDALVVALEARNKEMKDALTALLAFMWAEGYADQTPAMAKADAVLAKAGAR